MSTRMNTTEHVQAQYADGKGLSTRTSLHTKYGINKQGLYPWLFERYEFAQGDRILELGCGNGAQWEGRIDALPLGCRLTLSDFSEGLVQALAERYSGRSNVSFEQIDIQRIGYPDETFDVVIANHMLYHVPDLQKAFSEVRRILKPSGSLYASTNGNGGMWRFFHDAVAQMDRDTTAYSQEWSFSLQNGAELLSPYFSDVKKYDYEDALAVTCTQDLIDYMNSGISFTGYTTIQIDALYDALEQIRKRDGAIHIPKECGLFVAIK